MEKYPTSVLTLKEFLDKIRNLVRGVIIMSQRNGATDMERNSSLIGKKIREKNASTESLPVIGNVKYQYLFSDGKGLWENMERF